MMRNAVASTAVLSHFLLVHVAASRRGNVIAAAVSSNRGLASLISSRESRPFIPFRSSFPLRVLVRSFAADIFFDVEATAAAAKDGDIAAQSALGDCYLYGRGVERNPVEGVRLVRLAAEQGYAKAQYNLGRWLATTGTSIGTDPNDMINVATTTTNPCSPSPSLSPSPSPQDLKEAAHWYRLAADQGYADAQHAYSLYLATGTGTDTGTGVLTVDLEASVRYARLAADAGHAAAQHHLGVCLMDGTGTHQDLVESARYFKLAADQGISFSQYNYAVLLTQQQQQQQRIEELKHDGYKDAEAARYFRMAADSGFAYAQYKVAMQLMMDHHEQQQQHAQVQVPSSTSSLLLLQEAIRYLQLAADQGFAPALFTLGQCHEHGMCGFTVNETEAFRLYSLAADGFVPIGDHSNDSNSSSNSGSNSGSSGSSSNSSCSGGHAGAERVLGEWAMRGQGRINPDYKEGARRFRRAAGRGDGEAAYALSVCYTHGLGVVQDEDKAQRWAKWAIKCGFTPPSSASM